MNSPSGPTQGTKSRGLGRFWQLIVGAHPAVVDVEARRRVQLLASLSLSSLILFSVALPVSLATSGKITPDVRALVPFLLLIFCSYVLSRTRYYQAGAWLLTISLSLSPYAQLASGADPISSILVNVIVALLIGSALLSYRSMLILVVANIILVPLLLSQLRPDLETTVVGRGVGELITVGAMLLVVLAFRNNLEQQRLREVRQANQELDDIRTSLEHRTEELSSVSQEAQRRAGQLEAISEVGRAIAQYRDINELLPAVTRLISEHIRFYHVAIFLVDEKKEYAVLRAANSPGGQRMLARGHRLAVGQVGIVGYVAEQAKPRISLDVGADAIFFDNPDLPDTHSEMALPLIVGGETIGVLDVQSEQVSAFSQQDMVVMSTLGDQVAIAIENARSFTETRHALEEARAFYSQYLRQSWQQAPLEGKAVGYQYRNTMVVPITDPFDLPEIHSATKTGEPVIHTDKDPSIAIPLKLRGEVIGVLDIRSGGPSHQWTENEQAIVRAIAERATLAIENARLFQETTRRADRERTVSEITTSIRSKTDPEDMLQVALDELKRVLGASSVRVRPYEPPPAVPLTEDEIAKRKAVKPAKDSDSNQT